MDIEVTRSGQVTVVAPKGDLDMAVADQIRVKLTELIDGGQAKLVLDLALVSYVDSSGLGALVATMKQARSASGDIKICALQPDVRSVFDMTRLIKVMEVYGTRREAVTAWG
jgi:anti-sigma B factor antagonist